MKLYRGNDVIIERVETAGSFIKRLTGLLGKKNVPAGYGIYFPGCNSIHTFFMSCAIDVIMLSGSGKVESSFSGLNPWKIAVNPEACDTVETVPGTIAACGIKKGDILTLKNA